jgi:hypothetical protein
MSEKKVEKVYVMQQQSAKPKEDDERKEYADRMVIRSYSSMILLIPTFIAALICGIIQLLINRSSSLDFVQKTEGSGFMNIIGTIFIIIFALNIILLAFDFGRSVTIIISISIVAIVAILLLVNAYTGFITSAFKNIPEFSIYFSTQVYFIIAILLFLILLFTWLKTLFDYYEIEGNELIHHKGIGGGVERWAATNMSVVKEFPDLIELVIFRSGTLVLSPPRTDRAIVLQNVLRINKKIDEMNEILSRLKVDIN